MPLATSIRGKKATYSSVPLRYSYNRARSPEGEEGTAVSKMAPAGVRYPSVAYLPGRSASTVDVPVVLSNRIVCDGKSPTSARVGESSSKVPGPRKSSMCPFSKFQIRVATSSITS